MTNIVETQVSNKFYLTMRWTIVLSLWVLLISMAIGQFGLANYTSLRQSRDDLKTQIDSLKSQVQTAEEQITQLKTSEYRRINYLKANFGVVESGETIFHFKKTQ